MPDQNVTLTIGAKVDGFTRGVEQATAKLKNLGEILDAENFNVAHDCGFGRVLLGKNQSFDLLFFCRHGDGQSATHGFNRLGAYTLQPADWSHLPPGTEWVLLSGYYWTDWFKQHELTDLRWDKLAEAKAAGENLIPAGAFKPKPDYAAIMIDQEYGGLLPREELHRMSDALIDQHYRKG